MDPTDFANSNGRYLRPQSRKDAADYLKGVIEDSLLGAIICIPPKQPGEAATPIGTVHLSKLSPNHTHHRRTTLSIDIVKGYQGQGFGSEAIWWAVEWAFENAGMHRVAIGAFEYNYGARRLYERLGFVQEGIAREEIWYKGRFWDG
jgi:RimJ/RimL family protein N-acetyltransferase